MKIIVLGGNGFIAKNFIIENYRKKHPDQIISIDKVSIQQNFTKKINNKKLIFYKLDLSKKSLFHIFKKHKPDLIMNFAAETHVDKSISYPESFYSNNIKIVTNLLKDIELYKKIKKNIKFIQISTDEVFGSLKKNSKKFNENSAYNPQNPYAASKACCDLIIRSHANTFDLRYIIIHLTNNFGPYQNIEKLIPMTIFKLINRKKIPIYGSGLNLRDWLYVKDTSKILMKIIKSNLLGNICIGGNNEHTNIDLIKIILSNFRNYHPNFKHKLNSNVIYIKDRPGHDFRYALESSKFIKNLNWSPSDNFNFNINETIKWYMDNYKILDSMNNKKFKNWENLNYKKR